jgi:hypothetical protein
MRFGELLDGLPYGAEDLADLTAKEEKGDDGDDRDKREDKCIFRETLTSLRAPFGQNGRDVGMSA